MRAHTANLRGWAVRIAVLVLAGCVLRDDVVHLRLRDPARVELRAPGGATILPTDATRGDIPAAAYLREPAAGGWVERDAGTIEAWCPACRNWKRRTVVAGPELELDGTGAEVVRIEGGRVHARYLFAEGIPGRRGGLYPWPRLALELVTPVDNVMSAVWVAKVSDRNGGPPEVRRRFQIGGIVFGAAFAGGGVAFGALGLHFHEGGLTASGGAMIAVGSAIIAGMWYELRARDERVTLLP